MRPEYKRSDFAKLERGKFYAEATAGTYVVILDPKFLLSKRLSIQLIVIRFGFIFAFTAQKIANPSIIVG